MSQGTLRLYSYPRCSTCRKARAWLREHGVDVSVVDITLSPPSREELALAWERLPAPQRLFNTSGLSYRALGAAAVRSMQPEQALEALVADGKLIRRPFLISADRSLLLVGFDPQAWSEALTSPPPAPSVHPVPGSGR